MVQVQLSWPPKPSFAAHPDYQQTALTASSTMPQRSFHSPEDEVAYIHHETSRLEQLITRLHDERAALLRRLNAIQSLTTNLPTETLSSIFEHACPPPSLNDRHDISRSGYDDQDFELEESPPFQFVLSSVSSHWRQVVRSYPRLWDSISLNVNPRTVARSAAILRLFLEASKTVPFTLALRFPHVMGPNTPYLVHKSVDDLLVLNLWRIKELHLIHPPRCWHSHTHLLSQLVECSLDLERHETYNPDRRVILPSDAPLRRFTLQSALWRFDADFQLPFSSITSLTLSSIPPDLSVQVFIQCPNLVEFHCLSYSPFLPPLKPVTLLDPVMFNHLEVFEWETKDTPWSHALIRCLHVPVLRVMRWDAFDDPTNPHIQAFLRRLPPTLTKLELFPPSHFGYICENLNIEHLSMVFCTAQDILMVLQKLKPRWEDQRLVKPLPRLKTLKIDDDDNAPSNHLDHPDVSYSIAVLEMLDGRLDRPNQTFYFDIPSMDIQCLPEVCARLAQLNQAGFDVRINKNAGSDSDVYISSSP